MRPTGFRGRLHQDRPVLGTFVTEFHGAGVVHLAAAAGAEFVVLDDEHSATGRATMRQAIQAAHQAGVAAVVRAASPLPEHTSRALDLGAHGVLVPMVTASEQVRAIVAAAKYPPDGQRGVAISWMHHDHTPRGSEEPSLRDRLVRRNRSTAVLIQVETAAAVEVIDEIAGTPGVDCLWLGHLDLSTSLGVPGDLTAPVYERARRSVLEAASRHGLTAGHADLDGTTTGRLIKDGFTAVAVGTDADLYRSALSSALADAQQQRSKGTSRR